MIDWVSERSAPDPRSSNGRTAAFGAVNRGSNPCRGASLIKLRYAQSFELRPKMATRERADVSGSGLCETFEIVTALEKGDDPVLRVAGCEVADKIRQLAKVVVGQQKLPERIAYARIEAGGKKNCIGTESLGCGQQLVAESLEDSC